MIAKTHARVLGVLSLGAAAVSGCASSHPPRELVDARAAYARAQSGPAPQLSPDALHEAQGSLNQAESSFSASADEDDTRTLAYVAERRAQLADVRARDKENAQQAKAAQAEYQQIAEKRLADAQSQLASAGHQLQQSEQGRLEADQRAREALDRFAGTVRGSVKQDTRGLVLTLPGQVLFATGKSSLLPTARRKLDQVAVVLKQTPGQQMIVEGYTDATGKSERNQTLSDERANAVRQYLISRGVSAEQIRAQGFGQSQPVASNSTPEGRANNRRVEIIIQPASYSQ